MKKCLPQQLLVECDGVVADKDGRAPLHQLFPYLPDRLVMGRKTRIGQSLGGNTGDEQRFGRGYDVGKQAASNFEPLDFVKFVVSLDSRKMQTLRKVRCNAGSLSVIKHVWH